MLIIKASTVKCSTFTTQFFVGSNTFLWLVVVCSCPSVRTILKSTAHRTCHRILTDSKILAFIPLLYLVIKRKGIRAKCAASTKKGLYLSMSFRREKNSCSVWSYNKTN